jgi:hypothetical protein
MIIVSSTIRLGLHQITVMPMESAMVYFAQHL